MANEEVKKWLVSYDHKERKDEECKYILNKKH